MGVRAVVVGVVVLAALTGGAYAGDRWALGEIEDRVADEVRTGVDGVSGRPDVRIAGFPFLTQLAGGSFDDVTVALATASLSGVELQDVDVRARGVSTREPYTAQHAVVSGTLTTATLEQLVAERTDVDVALAVDGDRLTATLQVLRTDVTAELVPSAAGGSIAVEVLRLTFADADVDVDDLPAAVESRLQDLRVPVEGLPPGLALTDVVVRDDGVRVTATGTDVTFPEQP